MKRLLPILALLISFSAFATHPGPYIGGGVGVIDAIVDADTSLFFEAEPQEHLFGSVDSSLEATGSESIGMNSIMGQIFAGYGWLFSRYYVATEVHAAMMALNGSNTFKDFDDGYLDASLKTTAKLDHVYGASVLFGVLLARNAMFYARAGAVNGRFTFKSKQVESDPETESVITTGFTKKKTVPGAQVGGGIQVALSPNMSLRGEYVHTDYSSTDKTQAVSEDGYTVITDHKFRPQTDQATLSLVYSFGGGAVGAGPVLVQRSPVMPNVHNRVVMHEETRQRATLPRPA